MVFYGSLCTLMAIRLSQMTLGNSCTHIYITKQCDVAVAK